MKKLLSLYWQARIVFFAIRRTSSLHLGDKAMYRGEEWTLMQGVCAPRWTLSNTDGVRVEALESEFKAPFLKNAVRRYRSSYKFYMGYWHSIWVHRGIEPWMKACKIWGR